MRKPTLPHLLAERLMEEIRGGAWPSELPGTRVLAQRYGVDRKTCESALGILTERGFLDPPAHGKRRRIHAAFRDREKVVQGNLLLLHSTRQVLGAAEQDYLWKIAGIWRDLVGEAFVERVDFGRYRRPAASLGRLIDRHGASACFMLVPTAGWAAEAAKHLPTYCAGGDIEPDWTGTLSAFSIRDSVRDAALRLRELGHERIVSPIEGGWAKGRSTVQDGILSAFDGKHPCYTRNDLAPEFPEPVAEAWPGYWRKCFASLKPTAFILREESHLLSLYSFCAQHRIRIPTDLSVILLSHDERLEWLQPKPVMARYPYVKAINHFRSWISNGLQPLGRHLLTLQLSEEGQSIAPPAATGA
ncbi:GntR family transcriptional regulator [Haloferula helveola]|uniref:GntR family transcriptional regulator n=1 Tax=Haloferula helveola TaxID=490095 RepID=A0ABM7RBV7_9BACT|nr:GntR family transcriptional regulator [Haloferula helveola]